MDEKELDKKLNSDVKPGEEQFKINEAQNAANNLLTEQRANLESEKQIANANSTRDTELRGALELGAMSQEAAPQQQVALPPQAAGLRPETQQLLAKYGVNPTITESSRSNSNTNRTRSSTSNSQRMPNQNGGETRVTNTTNITNITNNNTETETNVDMPPAPPTPVVTPAPVRQPANNTNQFKTYMDNIFRKRDAEKALQEREFRKRDWSLQRMTRKVMARMESISSDFARKMNPENIGRTFWSQMKVFLFAAGLAILPKVFPKLIDGIDSLVIGVTDAFNFIKTTFNSKDGTFTQKLGQTFSASMEALNQKIAQFIGGDRWQKGEGIIDVISDKLSVAIGGDLGNGQNLSLMDRLSQIFNEIAARTKEYFNVLIEDRQKAVEDAVSNGTFSLRPSKLKDTFKSIGEVLIAALGGSKALSNMRFDNTMSEGAEKATEGADTNFGGHLKNQEGVNKTLANISDTAVSAGRGNTDTTEAHTIAAGVKEIINYSKEPESPNIVELDSNQLNKISEYLTPEGKTPINAGSYLVHNKELQDAGFTERVNGYTRVGTSGGKEATYSIGVPKEYVPAVMGLSLGMDLTSAQITDPEVNENLRTIFNDRDKLRDLVNYIDSVANVSGGIDWKAVIKNLAIGASLVAVGAATGGVGFAVGGLGVMGTVAYKNFERSIYTTDDEKRLGSNGRYASKYNYNRLADQGEYYAEEARKKRKAIFSGPEVQKTKEALGQTADQAKEAAQRTAEKVAGVVEDTYNTGKDLVMTGLYGKDYTGDQGGGQTPSSTQSTQAGQSAKVEKGETETTEAEVTKSTSTGTTTLPQAPMLEVEDYEGPELAPVAINKGSKPTETTEAVGGLTPYIARPKDQVDSELATSDSPEAEKFRNSLRSPNQKEIGRVYRNNNPGNIRKYKSKLFEAYNTLADGYAAMFNKITRWYTKAPITERSMQLKTADGKPVGGNPANTINKFIRIWAPGQDKNNEEAYVSYVERYTGIGRNQIFDINDKDTMTHIAEAMTVIEHLGGAGPTQQMKDSISQGFDMRGTVPKLAVSQTSGESSITGTEGGASGSIAESLKAANPEADTTGIAKTLSDSWEGAIDSLDKLLGADDAVAAVQKLPAEMQEFTDKLGGEEAEAEATQAQMNTQMPAVVANMESTAKGLLNYQPTDNGEAPEDTTDTSQTQQPQMISTVGPTTSVNNSGNTSITNLIINDPKNSFVDMKSRDHRHN